MSISLIIHLIKKLLFITKNLSINKILFLNFYLFFFNIYNANKLIYLKMSLFGYNTINNLNSAPTLSTPQKTNNLFSNATTELFGNTNNNNNNNPISGGGLFSNTYQQNNNTSIFSNINPSNTNSNFFSTNNNNSFFSNQTNSFFPNNTNSSQNSLQNKDSTIGFQFKGLNIQEKNGNSIYMSITSQPEFLYASQEELRMADYEKKQTGNIIKFKINNTSKNGTISSISSNSNNYSFISNNNNTQNKGLFNGNNIFSSNSGTTSTSIFGNNNNQNTGIFGSNNTQSTGIFGNNNKNQTGGIFGNNNTQTSSLFGNNNQLGTFSNNNSQGGGLFGNINNNQGGGLFGNNNNNQGGGLFGNNNNNQGGGLFGQSTSIFGNNNNSGGLFGNNNNQSTNNQGSLFGNNTNNNQGGLFGNNTSSNTQGGLFGNNTSSNQGGLFGNNTSSNQGGLFGNNTNNNQGGLFGNNTSNNNQGNSLFNNDKRSSLFNNNNNNQGGLFGNNNNTTSANTNTSLFGNNNNGGSLFGNNQNNNSNKNIGTSLFGNTNTTSLFGNTSSNNSSTGLFSNNANSSTGLFGQSNKSLFGGTNSTGNMNSTQQSLFGNNNTQQINNNTLSNQNITLYSDITYEDIMNPLNYINTQKTLKLSPQDELLSKSIVEAIQKQKSVKEFLEDLDKKYENVEKNDDNNNDILASYGTYLTSSNNYDIDNSSLKRSLNIKIDNDSLSSSYRNIKYRKMDNYQKDISSYNNIELSKSISKINDIYGEYEKYKNKFNNNGNIYLPQSKIDNYKKNDVEVYTFQNNKSKNEDRRNIYKTFSTSNGMIGRDEGLYQRNLIEFNKLNNYNISTIQTDNNNNQYQYEDNNDKENNEILIMNYQNEKENNEMIDLTIKCKLPEEEDNNILVIHLENVNQLVKIQTLREEIKSRIYNELKIRGLDKKYAIEKISLLIQGGFLDDNKKLSDYDFNDYDFNIQAFITYNSIASQNKNTQIKKNNKLKVNQREIKIKKEKYINENELVPIDLVPKLTKEGYKCTPSIMELSRKTAAELRKIEYFKVFNKFGEVEFKEPINLLGLNLDNQVTIEKNLIDTGDKLDYKSVFKLYNFRVEENGLNRHKINLKRSGGKFLSYENNVLVWEYPGKN